MKRRKLIRHLTERGCVFDREGGRHTLYWNPDAKKGTAVPKHTKIAEPLAWKICRDLGIPKP